MKTTQKGAVAAIALAGLGFGIWVTSDVAEGQQVGPVYCSESAIGTTPSGGGTTLAVAPAGKIYICGLELAVIGTSVTTGKIEYGAGSACTNPTVITPTFGNGSFLEDVGPTWRGLSIPAGDGVCIATAASDTGSFYRVDYAYQ